MSKIIKTNIDYNIILNEIRELQNNLWNEIMKDELTGEGDIICETKDNYNLDFKTELFKLLKIND